MHEVPLAAIKVLRLMAAYDLETYRRLKLAPELMDSIEPLGQLPTSRPPGLESWRCRDRLDRRPG